MQKYISRIILIITFNIIQDINPIKAQKAGLIAFVILFLCKYSHINAHANGHKINHIGPKNIQIIIQMIHHRFHNLVHQNFLVHKMGR